MTTATTPGSDDGANPVGVRRTATYFPEIESLRGIAMLLVYLFHLRSHLAGVGKLPEDRVVSPLVAFIAAGHTGVSLFFVLSGFLLSLPFIAEAAGGKHVDRRNYFRRRALRILPLYYVAVLLGTIVCAQHISDLWHGVPYLFFLNGIGNMTTKLPPYSNVWWSLATEMQYYLLLPFLPFFLRTRTGRIAGLVVFFGYAAAYGLFLLGRFNVFTIPGYMALKLSVFGRGPLFLGGIAVAWLYHHYGADIRAWMARSAWIKAGGGDIVLLLVLTALGFLLRWQHRGLYDTPPEFAWRILEGGIWATVLALVLLAPLRLKPLISNAPLSTLGILSYSMYLWHEPIIFAAARFYFWLGFRWQINWNAHTVALAIIITIVCLAVSQVTYRWIERPFLARKARVE